MNILRAFCIIGVLVIHTSDVSGSFSPWLLTANQIARFSVPGFVFLSGYLLAWKYNNKKIESGTYLKNRVLLLGVPYIFWSVIYIFISFRKDAGEIFTLKPMIYLFTGWGHLFFIFMIFQLYAFYIIFKNKIENNPRKFLYWSVLASFLYYLVVEVLYYKKIITSEEGFQKVFIPWAGFFFMGQAAALCPNLEDFVKKYILAIMLIWVACLSADLMDGRNHYNIFGKFNLHYFRVTGFLVQSAGIVFFYSLSVYLKSRRYAVDLFDKISLASFGIYLNHVLFIKVFQKVTGTQHPFPYNFISVFLMSFIAASVFRKYAFHKFVYGR